MSVISQLSGLSSYCIGKSISSDGNTIMARGVNANDFHKPAEIKEPQMASQSYMLPIDHPDGVIVTQGPKNLSEGRSHGYINSLFAIDLSSGPQVREPANISPPAQILAAREGMIIGVNNDGVYDGPYYNIDS